MPGREQFAFFSAPRTSSARRIAERPPNAAWLGAAVILAPALAWSAPAQAEDAAVRVMTQNVYQGTNFDEVLAATTFPEFLAAVTTTYNNVMATQPAERAQAVANEI